MHFHIFCRVIDNFGDAGITWRLARRLADAGHQATLVIDAPEVIERLAPESVVRAGVQILEWRADVAMAADADVVIEAFACELPASYVAEMAARTRASVPVPVWINLEYLSAEAWVESHHRLPSRHPQLPLTKYFFFPGFSAATGGLLKCFDATNCVLSTSVNRIFLFAYDTAEIPLLCKAFSNSEQRVELHVADGPLAKRIRSGWQAGQGALTINYPPFVPQAEFDALLAAQHINIVRGEDSFVRAQLAGVPMLWQIYRQNDDAHLEKLAAWLARYLAKAPPAVALVVRALSAWLNPSSLAVPIAPSAVSALWARVWPVLPAWQAHALRWAEGLENGPDAPPDLAESLVSFVESKLE